MRGNSKYLFRIFLANTLFFYLQFYDSIKTSTISRYLQRYDSIKSLHVTLFCVTGNSFYHYLFHLDLRSLRSFIIVFSRVFEKIQVFMVSG